MLEYQGLRGGLEFDILLERRFVCALEGFSSRLFCRLVEPLIAWASTSSSGENRGVNNNMMMMLLL